MFEGKRLKVWESKIGDGNYSNLINGQIVKIYNDGIGVKVENGEIILTVIQPEGKSKMKVSDYLNGIKNKEEMIGKILD